MRVQQLATTISQRVNLDVVEVFVDEDDVEFTVAAEDQYGLHEPSTGHASWDAPSSSPSPPPQQSAAQSMAGSVKVTSARAAGGVKHTIDKL